MPPKRERIDSSEIGEEEESKPKTEPATPTTPTKRSRSNPSTPSPAKKSWTEAEERTFREGINNIVKKHLWTELKGNPMMAKRGANGVSQHWIALSLDATFKYSKLFHVVNVQLY
ncbi:hypothetical protein I317_05814 [Kwoniella heveanensis CBS 569]|nr:hypothetical protein I317_05814 [Kwoniella heveanensis CBS 569]